MAAVHRHGIDRADADLEHGRPARTVRLDDRPGDVARGDVEQLIIRLDAQLTEQHGISIADYSALMVIAEGPPGGIRMSSLAEFVMISRSRLTSASGHVRSHWLYRAVSSSL